VLAPSSWTRAKRRSRTAGRRSGMMFDAADPPTASRPVAPRAARCASQLAASGCFGYKARLATRRTSVRPPDPPRGAVPGVWRGRRLPNRARRVCAAGPMPPGPRAAPRATMQR
jgi:hypothetical protein